MKSCYTAGPDVFHPSMEALAEGKKALCRRYGIEGRFPLDNGVDLAGLDPRNAAMRIYDANVELMRSCDFLIANLTPFRGLGADAGTVFEVGFMAGLGRPVAAYSLDDKTYLDRVSAGGWLDFSVPGSPVRDLDGQVVEDFGLPDNLMMPGALRTPSGADLFVVHPGDWRRVDDHLAAFDLCLQRLIGAASKG